MYLGTSAQRKFSRGIEQVKTLCGEARAFENRDAYTFHTEIESRTTNEIKYSAFALEREAPLNHWPLLAGEAIQNLRAALDHAVYAATRRPGPRSQFPIFTDRCEFQVLSPRQIPRIPEAMRATVERAQPYNHTPADPKSDLLELLLTYSNIDKHRALATVAGAVQLEYVGIGEGVGIKWDEYGTDKILDHGKTYISRFTAIAETEIDEMKVDPGFTYQVRIEGRPLEVLMAIVRRVYPILRECETGEPPSPFEFYGI